MRDPNINFASFVLSLAATAAVHFGDRLEPGEVEPGPVDLQAAGQMIDILEPVSYTQLTQPTTPYV
jgi:hypothetical protein